MSDETSLLIRQKQDWEILASLDPYWAVASRSAAKHGNWDIQEFFEIGRRKVARAMDVADRLGHPKERGSVLDFGCGVGRTTRALSSYFAETVGVDISDTMVNEAKRLHADLGTCTFVVNERFDLGLFPDERFDMVYTSAVLQHLPDRRLIEGYTRDFIRTLRPDGLLAFQLPSYIPVRYRFQLRRTLYRVLVRLGLSAEFLYRRLALQPIKMQFVPEEEVLRLMESEGARMLEVETNEAAFGVRSSTYYCTK